MPKYYVGLDGGNSTIVEAKRKATAKNYARREFGNSFFQFIRLATEDEVAWNAAMSGRVHQVSDD